VLHPHLLHKPRLGARIHFLTGYSCPFEGRLSRAPLWKLGTLIAHPYLALALGYSVTLWVFCWSSGSFSDSLTVTFLVAVTLAGLACVGVRRARPWLTLVMIGLSYEVISGPIDAGARPGAFSLYGLDSHIWGFNLPAWMQRTFASGFLTDATSVLYLSLIPLVGAITLVMWRFGRAYLHGFVLSLAITSYCALVTFLLAPTAPPWFSGEAQNLVASSGMGTAASVLSPLSALVKPDYVAAFPSLHAAYTITSAYFLFKIGPRWGIFGSGLALATLFSTLYLGQHYSLDLIGGAVYSLVPCLVIGRLGLANPLARGAAPDKPPPRSGP